MKRVALTVPSEQAGIRLDRFLAGEMADESRASIQRWIHENRVRVNGEAAKSSHKVRGGDRIELEAPDRDPEAALLPWICPLNILYEDEHLMAVNKPPGMVTHPGAGNRAETLANALIAIHPSVKDVGHPLRPGIVHRLDKETSGILLVALTHASYVRLSRMFRERQIEKHYRALAYGRFDRKEGRVEQSLGRDPFNRQKISVRATRSRNAVTFYHVLRQFDFGALLDVRILTGRTHQIRVHLSFLNHPLVGDGKYGGGNWNRIADPGLRDRLREARFFGLHAFSLDFTHPITGTLMHLEAPLPASWNVVISSNPKS